MSPYVWPIVFALFWLGAMIAGALVLRRVARRSPRLSRLRGGDDGGFGSAHGGHGDGGGHGGGDDGGGGH
jgi:uncharacterized membrane protein YgcG